MKIEEFNQIKIGACVLYKDMKRWISDIDRSSHSARLGVKPGSTGGGWIRCSEFSTFIEVPKVPKKTVKKEKRKPANPNWHNSSPIGCKAINIHRAHRMEFRSLTRCADFFETSLYYVEKAIRNKTPINGYMIYKVNEKEMGIEEYKESIAKCRADIMAAMQAGQMRKVMMFQKELELLSKRLKELEDDDAKYEKMLNSDEHFSHMMGKTLSLILNEADLAIYHLDIYFAAVQSFGLVDKAKDWTNAKNRLRKALREFGFFPRILMNGEVKSKNEEVLCDLISRIRNEYYTAEEQKYYDKYEELSGNY